jgi:TonB-linked SusC/RagA family outer membrane protein
VTNPGGEPLPGVSITATGTTAGVATDTYGAFRIDVPPSTDSLTFSYTGYATQRLPVRRGAPLRVVLRPVTYGLSEVVVVGFGEKNRRTLTGAVAAVDRRAFENVSVPTWEQALQGRLPGVSITPASGGLDAAASIRIRGVGSISAGNQPLIVIDGIVLSGQGGIESLGYQTNPFIALNPEDIASVEVLKDAAAGAVYGARAANGVILITTKSGRYGAAPRVNLNYYGGFSEITQRYDLLTGPEYATLWNEAARNSNITEGLYADPAEEPTTDWQSLLLRRGFVQQAQASVSGGTENSRFYLSGTFRDENGYLITTNLKRYSVRANFEQRLGKRWTAGISLAPTRVVDERVGNQFRGSPFGWASWYFPNVSAFHEGGQPIRTPLSTSNGSGGFPGNPLLTAVDQEATVTTQQLLARGHVTFVPLPGLRLRTEVATETSQENEWRYAGPATFFGFGVGSGSVEKQSLASFQWTNQVDWSPGLPTGHNLDITAGTQLVQTRFDEDYISGSDFPNDEVRYLTSTAQIDYFESGHTRSAFLGYFGRADYQWRGRYLLGLSARYDGSSRFGTDRRFGFFPAISAGWIVSEEALWSSSLISFLKLRASYGLTGNAEIGDFTVRGLVTTNNDYLGQPGYVIQSLENRRLGWEKSRQGNVGLDFAFGAGRFRGSVDYFVRDTRDLLLEVPAPATNGVSVVLDNVGAVRNSGVEFTLSADLLRGPLQWSVNLNGGTVRNRVLELADRDAEGGSDDIVLNNLNLFRPGQPAGAFYLVRYAGVDPANGDALFYDSEGNQTAEYSTDYRQVVGSPIPRFSGGLTQNFRYRNVELTVFLQGKTGHQRFLWHELLIADNMTEGANQLRTQLAAWRPDNPDTDVPQARLDDPNGNQISTRYLYDADFLRLQNLQLAYTFPALGQRAIRLRLFAAAQHLVTWTDFPGLDPDSEFYPTQRAAQGGVSYNLPAARTYTVGVNVSL